MKGIICQNCEACSQVGILTCASSWAFYWIGMVWLLTSPSSFITTAVAITDFSFLLSWFKLTSDPSLAWTFYIPSLSPSSDVSSETTGGSSLILSSLYYSSAQPSMAAVTQISGCAPSLSWSSLRIFGPGSHIYKMRYLVIPDIHRHRL